MYTIKIPQQVYAQAMGDLQSPHPFAAERVGFMYGRSSALDDVNTQLLITNYVKVSDDQYIEDPTVGAKIGTNAVRLALQHALESGDVVLHVHRHDHRGQPAFSPVDEQMLEQLVPSFVAAAPNAPHGGLVLSIDNGCAAIWAQSRPSCMAANVTVVGFPSKIWRFS